MPTSRNRTLPQILKWAAIFGISFGLVSVIGGVIDYTIGYNAENEVLNGLNYLSRIAGLLICMIIYRNKVLHKNISFSQAFLFGFFTFAFIILIVDFSIYLFLNYYPDILATKIKIIEARLQRSGLNEQQIAAKIQSTLWIKKPLMVTLSVTLWIVFVGSFVSFVAAVLMMDTPARRRLKRRYKQKQVKNKEAGPSISSILLKSNPEFNGENYDNESGLP